jgi:hypothetical protein
VLRGEGGRLRSELFCRDRASSTLRCYYVCKVRDVLSSPTTRLTPHYYRGSVRKIINRYFQSAKCRKTSRVIIIAVFYNCYTYLQLCLFLSLSNRGCFRKFIFTRCSSKVMSVHTRAVREWDVRGTFRKYKSY